ncbi:hypothetical protein BJ912DRAFT_997456 [Pholiota molesta]|nr:hypothetical protein BJ912DRAFT_997456 [Pholiota molesta]
MALSGSTLDDLTFANISTSSLSNPDCVYLDHESGYDDFINRQITFSTQLMTYYCPSRIPIKYGWAVFTGNDILPQPYTEFQPDLLVTVNFTTLGIATDTITDIPSNSVQVMVAMTNRTIDVMSMTVPTTLIPGVNLVGIASMEIHRKFKNPGLSWFGLFESMQSTVIAQINQVFPDPQAGISPMIIRSPEIATIRVSKQAVVTQWTIIQDSKDKSFFNGLSQTGGLWTFLSGVFAVVFGGSLMRILFGTKPVSVFGLAHGWERNAIRKAYREEYPAIAEEINAPRDQRGILYLLQEHVIDLGLTEETRQGSSTVPEDSDSDVELDNFERGLEETDQDQAATGGAR